MLGGQISLGFFIVGGIAAMVIVRVLRAPKYDLTSN